MCGNTVNRPTELSAGPAVTHITIYPHFAKQRGYTRTTTFWKHRDKSHLRRDASVPSVPQTNTRRRLHLIRGSPGCLVALSVWPHLQVLVDDIWRWAKRKVYREHGGVDKWSRSVKTGQGATPDNDFNRKEKHSLWHFYDSLFSYQATGCIRQTIYKR